MRPCQRCGTERTPSGYCGAQGQFAVCALRAELRDVKAEREREYQRAEVAEACVAAAWEALGYTHRAESESPFALGVAIESYGQRMVDESWAWAVRLREACGGVKR